MSVILYESLTRAKTQLVIVTIDGKQRCEEYCGKYKDIFGQGLPDCQFKGNKSKIQNLLRKVHIDADGSETQVQFGIETSDGEDFKIVTTENQEKNVLELEVDTSTGQSDSKNSKENDYLLSKIEDLEVNLSNTKAEITELEATLKKFKASIKKSATESKDMSTQTEQN